MIPSESRVRAARKTRTSALKLSAANNDCKREKIQILYTSVDSTPRLALQLVYDSLSLRELLARQCGL